MVPNPTKEDSSLLVPQNGKGNNNTRRIRASSYDDKGCLARGVVHSMDRLAPSQQDELKNNAHHFYTKLELIKGGRTRTSSNTGSDNHTNDEILPLCSKGFTMNNLHEQIPEICILGMQSMERLAETSAVEYATSMMIDDGGTAVDSNSSRRYNTFSPMIRHDTVLAVHQRMVEEVTMATFSWSLTMAVSVAVLAQLLVGFNIGVMNAPEPVVFPGHGTVAWSLAVASFGAGAPFGAKYAGLKADERGRKSTILATARLFFVGGLVQSLAPRLWVIMMARFFIGFASGCTMVLIPIYLGELAPPTLRGTIGTVTQFSTVIGLLVADLVSFPLAKATPLWRLLFGVNALVACCIFALSPFLLESPRWLLQRDESSKEARAILRTLRNIQDERLVDVEVLHVLSAVKTQGSGVVGSLTDILKDPNTRSLLVGAFVLHAAQQLSGINAVFFYSNSFFKGVIQEPLVGTTIVGAVNVIATYGSLLVMESTDRRSLLLLSSGGMMICSIILILSLVGFFSNIVALGAVNLYVILFELGLGPIPWLIVPELFSPKYVSSAASAATQVNCVFSFLVSLGFPFLQKALGAYSFAPFVFCHALTFIYTLWLLPETRGKTPQEVYLELEARQPLLEV